MRIGDIFRNVPEIGDTIVYNPPYVKGLDVFEVVGFAKSGLPMCVDERRMLLYKDAVERLGVDAARKSRLVNTPKTEFVIIYPKPGE